MATMDVKDAVGSTVTIEKPLAPGRAAAASSRPVALSTEDLAALSAITAKLLSAPATEAKQDTLIAKDFATQATLAALLAKVIASPSTEAKQDTMITALAGLHTDLATTLAPYLDGLEGLIGTSNSSLSSILTALSSTIAGYVDGLETLTTSSNTKLDSIHTDLATTLAGYVDGLEALATSLNGYVDGLEGLTGAVTETAPASDTASSGLNGRLQRIAQRLTTLIAGHPVFGADGATAASNANGLPVSSVSREIAVAGTTLTRPANTTAYAAGDSISDNGTAGSVSAQPVTVSDVNDAPVTLTDIMLDTTDTGLAAGIGVDVFVYNSDPTASSGVGGGDNAAFSNKRAGFVGRFRGTFVAFSDGGKAICRPVDGDNALMPVLNTKPASGAKTLWLQYKAVAGFTPSANSTTIIPTVRGFQGRA